MLIAPAFASAQVEVGVDAGFAISMFDGSDENTTTFHMPTAWARVAYAAGELLLIEPILGLEHHSEGSYSENRLLLVPGVNLLLGDRLYVRGEAGLVRYSESDTSYDLSSNQYGFGGGAGMRSRLGDAAVLRLEGVIDHWLENTDDRVPARTEVRAVAGVSAIIN